MVFNNAVSFVHDKIPVSAVSLLTQEEYTPNGLTALYDAIGETLERLRSRCLYARKRNIPNKTLVFIMTDGKENASRRFDGKTIKTMIENKKEAGWEFVFLAANIDAEETARDIGISEDRAIGWHADRAGLRSVGIGINRCMESVVTETIFARADFAEVDEDFQKRTK